MRFNTARIFRNRIVTRFLANKKLNYVLFWLVVDKKIAVVYNERQGDKNKIAFVYNEYNEVRQ